MKNNTQLLVKAAQLYYDEDVNQNDLADILGISRPTVSRLLKRAKAEGIVEIIVHDPIVKNHEISSLLREKLGLRDVVVIEGAYEYVKSLERCCEAAVQYLDAVMFDGCTIGITWGLVPQTICDIIPPLDHKDVTIVQMVGCLGTNLPGVDGSRLAIQLSQKLGGKYYNIYSPVFVHNKEVRDYLCNEPAIKETLEISAHTDILINGIGSFDTYSTIFKAGYWNETDIERILSSNAVGHLLGKPFDKDGKPVEIDGTYIVGAPLEYLHEAQWSIGVSASSMKSRAVMGAIRGGYINVLIADQSLANALLKLVNEEE